MQEDGQKKEADSGSTVDHAVGLIIATPSEIYSIESDYSFHAYDRWAIGSGYLYGMGHFDALKTGSGAARIEKAIAATSDLVCGVGGPVTVWQVKP